MLATFLDLPNRAWWALIAASPLVYAAISYRRAKRDYRRYLEPPLRNCGVEYVSAVSPGLFKTGPFPKIEVEVGRPLSNFLGLRGEYCEYRIVKVRDTEGNLHEIWAVIEFEVFKLRRVRWRAEHKENLPLGILAMLEI
jgi:hypothetical protein